jgi:hypothetical protein
LNCSILYAIRDHLTVHSLSTEELGRLMEDCQRLERACRFLHGESRIYAERTADLARIVMPTGQCQFEPGGPVCAALAVHA